MIQVEECQQAQVLSQTPVLPKNKTRKKENMEERKYYLGKESRNVGSSAD
jgi:hypothetical protein